MTLCCSFDTQALTSSRRTLQIIEHDGLALFDRITRHHEDDAGVVYYTLYCCYEIALGSKSTQVKKKLENQDVVAQLLRIGTHCLARAVAADMQRPWQDVAEMASRLMTEMTICAPTHVVKHLVSLENQQAGATINTVDVIAATLRKYAEIEHVEKFAFWFLLAVYRAQRKTGKDVDLINIQRWHQMLVPLIDLRAEHEPKAQELKQLLAPHVKLATRELVQDKSKGQGQSNSAVGEPVVYRQKGVSLLRQLAEACKADELAVAINAALIMEAAGLLSGDASLALEQDELEAHLRILEDLHWHNHEGLTVLLRLARHKPSPKLAAKLADTVFVLLERGAVLSCFSSWSTTELATCEIAALLTNVADGLTFPLTQAPKKQHSKPSSPSPSSPSVSSSSPAATPSSGQPAAAPIVQSAAEQAERRLRALSAVRTVFGVVPATTLPPPPPEIDGELCVHAVAQLLKMLERDRALPASQLQADKMGMRLIALADQVRALRLIVCHVARYMLSCVCVDCFITLASCTVSQAWWHVAAWGHCVGAQNCRTCAAACRSRHLCAHDITCRVRGGAQELHDGLFPRCALHSRKRSPTRRRSWLAGCDRHLQRCARQDWSHLPSVFFCAAGC